MNSMQSTMMFYQYIVKILMTIGFIYSEYCKEADIISVRKIAEVLKKPPQSEATSRKSSS